MIFPILFIGPLVYLLPKLLKLFGFPTFRLWVYLLNVIPETCRAHKIWYLRFYFKRHMIMPNIFCKLLNIVEFCYIYDTIALQSSFSSFQELVKMFNESDSFYFSETFDLTNSIQKQYSVNYDRKKFLWQRVDDRFFCHFRIKLFIITVEPKIASVV